MIKQINPEIAQKWLNSGEACIIDVREPFEHKAQSIKNSILIPLAEFDSNKIPTELKNKKIIIHCQKGGRSSKACQKAFEQDPALDIYNLEGGIVNWSSCGIDTKCANDAKCNMSVERQVRLIMGLLVFTGSILTVFIDQKFIFLPTFIGFALMFTAIIDWCGIAKLLALMPWNK